MSMSPIQNIPSSADPLAKYRDATATDVDGAASSRKSGSPAVSATMLDQAALSGVAATAEGGLAPVLRPPREDTATAQELMRMLERKRADPRFMAGAAELNDTDLQFTFSLEGLNNKQIGMLLELIRLLDKNRTAGTSFSGIMAAHAAKSVNASAAAIMQKGVQSLSFGIAQGGMAIAAAAGSMGMKVTAQVRDRQDIDANRIPAETSAKETAKLTRLLGQAKVGNAAETNDTAAGINPKDHAILDKAIREPDAELQSASADASAANRQKIDRLNILADFVGSGGGAVAGLVGSGGQYMAAVVEAGQKTIEQDTGVARMASEKSNERSTADNRMLDQIMAELDKVNGSRNNAVASVAGNLRA